MRRIFPRVNLAVLGLGAVLRGFDAAYLAARSHYAAVPPDSLLHYNMILGWWQHGDSPRGFTLTPSPYFIDIALQLPIALLAPDFERFSYALALVFALLILASLFAVLRIAFAPDRVLPIAAASVTVVGFYLLAPFSLIVHSFIYNHTSEVFSTLGVVALLYALFRPDAPRRRYAPVVYTLAVAACVASSPFFIATYCVPGSIAVASVLGTEHVSWRRLGGFLALSVAGALTGLVALAILDRYVWPIRVDSYGRTAWHTYKAFKHTLYVDPRLWHLAWATMIGVAASIVLAIVGRVRAWPARVRFLLAYFPASVASCIVFPIERGAFFGAYELRYLQIPWLLTVVFYVAGAAWGTRAIFTRLSRRRWSAARPGWAAWSAAVLGAGGVALVVTAGGPLTMSDPASTTSSTIRCFADAEKSAALQDGLATTWMARYLNAARRGPDWKSPYVIVQIYPTAQPTIDPRENNLVWFDGGYRGGRTKLNFLVTHTLGDDALRAWRDRLGLPDRTISCPSPIDVRGDGKPSFELWIWDREDAQRKLAEIATRDNLRSPFSPVIGATSVAIDVTWGMVTDPHDGELVGGHRVWRSGVHRDGGSLAVTRPMYVPSGRYRLEIDLSAVPREVSAEPVAEVVVQVERRSRIERFPIAPGVRHAVMEIEIENRGGATSGDAVVISVSPRAARSIELTGMTLAALELRGIAPFRIFH